MKMTVPSHIDYHCGTSPQTGRGNPPPNRLFLTGPSGCGKSTLLRKALRSKLTPAGGFITERTTDETGRYLYFYLQQANQTGPHEIFLDLRQKPPVRHNEVFTQTAARLLAQPAPFFLLDEIGGLELLLPEFRTALDTVLASDTPCIGVLKGLQSSQALTKTAGLPEAYLTAAADLRRRLEADPHTRILEVTSWDDDAVWQAVIGWVEEYANG